ncbi:hypothetical protein VIH_003021 [Vibrio cholerae CT 5369-93]|nr:hypothetical protein VIH_003021 [Vibrio cholerae CT 5369-93]
MYLSIIFITHSGASFALNLALKSIMSLFELFLLAVLGQQ